MRKQSQGQVIRGRGGHFYCGCVGHSLVLRSLGNVAMPGQGTTMVLPTVKLVILVPEKGGLDWVRGKRPKSSLLAVPQRCVCVAGEQEQSSPFSHCSKSSLVSPANVPEMGTSLTPSQRNGGREAS